MGGLKEQKTKITNLKDQKAALRELAERKVQKRETNRISLVIGGRERIIVIGMKISIFISELIPKGTIALNLYERYVEIVYMALQRAENDLPDNYDIDLVYTWLDDVPVSEWAKVREFIDDSMGFIIQDYIISMEKLGGSLGELVQENLTADQPTMTLTK